MDIDEVILGTNYDYLFLPRRYLDKRWEPIRRCCSKGILLEW